MSSTLQPSKNSATSKAPAKKRPATSKSSTPSNLASKSSKKPRRLSKYAIYSGYRMTQSDFKEFILSLPELPIICMELHDPPGLNECVLRYDQWRRCLPGDVKSFAPKVRVRYISKEAELSEGRLEERVTDLFFLVRFVRYKGAEQLTESHPDYMRITQESETDKALRQSFMQYVQSCGGKLNHEMVKFGYEKMLHPDYDEYGDDW